MINNVREARNLAKRVKSEAIANTTGDPTTVGLVCELADVAIELAAACEKLQEEVEVLKRDVQNISRNPALT